MIKQLLSWLSKKHEPSINEAVQETKKHNQAIKFIHNPKHLDYVPTLDEWLSEHSLQPHVENAVRMIAKPTIALTNLRPNDPVPLGSSRIGGLPDMPIYQAWPSSKVDGYAMVFLCQINLAEISIKSALPQNGWLYFFLDFDEPAYNIRNTVIYIPENTELIPTQFPDGFKPSVEMELVGQNTFPQCQFNFSPSFDLTMESKEFDTLTEKEQDKIYDTSPRFESHLFGWHKEWNGDARRDAYFYAKGMESIQYLCHFTVDDYVENAYSGEKFPGEDVFSKNVTLLEDWHTNQKVHQQEIQRWKILFTLGSHQEAKMCWWDAGLLEFLIHEDDLANRDFSKIYCNLASS